VAAIADTTVVVQAPEMGDEVQAIKAGLLEVADLVVVNKADRPGAHRAAAQLRAMLTVGAKQDRAALAAGRPRPKRPEVLLTTAATGDGVPQLLAALDRLRVAAAPGPPGEVDQASVGPDLARSARARVQLDGILGERLQARLAEPAIAQALEEAVSGIAAHRTDPYAAADRLLAALALR
jgi:LAO/AO transport system kinase